MILRRRDWITGALVVVILVVLPALAGIALRRSTAWQNDPPLDEPHLHEWAKTYPLVERGPYPESPFSITIEGSEVRVYILNADGTGRLYIADTSSGKLKECPGPKDADSCP